MNPLLQRFFGHTFATYSRLIGGTIRLQIHNRDRVDPLIEQGVPLVGAGIHRHTRVAAAIAKYLDLPGNKPISGIIAGDDRQVLLETFYNALGLITYAIGMEEDTFSAARELLRLIKDMKSGRIAYTYLAIDGPDGPAFVAKPGVAFIARRAEALIVPLAIKSPQAIVLKSRWDKMEIPVPWSDVHFYVGQPFPVSRKMAIDDILAQTTDAIKLVYQQLDAIAP